jgi:3-hydroxyisobutyrate dehydrogenase-like beta-hydroxyacid dehydrogenase
MNFMIGGDAALIERCRPILSCLGTVITRAGNIGAGHSVKAINMLALASSMLATSELLTIGLHHGGSLDALVETMQASSGASYSTKVHFPRFIVPGNYNSNFTFDLMLKDLGIGIGLADSVNIPLFVQRGTYELYRASTRLGFMGKDNTRIVQGILSVGARHGDPDESALRRLEIAAAACNRVVASESLCLGAAAGVDPATVQSILSAGSADSAALRSMLDASDGRAGILLTAWHALCAASADADRWRLPAPLLRQVTAIHASTMERFGPETDSRAVLHLMAEWTGQSSHFDRKGEFS